MAVSYLREMNHNYMIIESSEQEPCGYECKMLAGNAIEGLLKFRIRHHEEKKEFCYEITSKQPLNRLLEQKNINGSEIRRLLLGIAATLSKIEEYLLREDRILLEPEYIYIEPDQFSVYLCMVPGYSGDFPTAFTALLQYVLNKVNHQDKDGVVLAYNLYHESLKDNYGMPDLLGYLSEGKEGIFGNNERDIQENADRDKNQTVSRAIGKRSAEGEGRRELQEKDKGTDAGDIAAQDLSYRPVHSKKEKTVSHKRRGFFMEIIKGALFLAFAEAALWLLAGTSVLMQYGQWICVIILGVGFGRHFLRSMTEKKNHEFGTSRGKEEGRGKKGKERESWKIDFEDKPIKRKPIMWEEPDFAEGELRETEKTGESSHSREPETTLLADIPDQSDRVLLESLNRERDSIEIPYMPFVIGKHAEMADYCLSQPTISRLHLRVEKKEGVYIVTDLNTTNGTTVEGYHLQANETVSVKNGDTIFLADAGYRFIEPVR